MRTDYVEDEAMGHVLALLMPANRLVMRVALETGLRVGDVLALRSDALSANMSVSEAKTGKERTVTISDGLLRDLRRQAGAVWVFEGSRSPERHRTRQAVWADVKRASRALRMRCNVAPHSGRKAYAVALLRQTGDLDAVQEALNHDRIETTMLYAMADRIRTPLQRRKRR